MTDAITDAELGILLGLVIGGAHFGGDGRQPQMTLKMHVRHEPLLRWMAERLAGAKLYGPYHHGDRHYLQLMLRGAALRDFLPHLAGTAWREIDPYSFERFRAMCERYGLSAGE